MNGRWNFLPAVVGGLACCALGVPGAAAQVAPPVGPAPAKAATPRGVHGAPPNEARSVRGRVVRGGAAREHPLGGAWVVLHRVGTDRAAPLDSIRTDATGRYAFRYRTSGDPRAVYFASSTYGGVAYFTAPLQAVAVGGAEAELVVFDTTSAPVPIRVRARHVVLSAPAADQSRTIIEVFELSNDSSVTRVATGTAGVVWESVLADGAHDQRLGQADFSPAAVRFEDGRVRLSAPFAPGLKQLSFSYVVPKGTEYSLLIPAPAQVMEVLVEDPLGRAEGGGLIASGPTTVGDRSFSRFLAQEVRANAVVRLRAPGQGSGSETPWRLLLVVTAVGAALLVGLARSMMHRPAGVRRASGAVDAAELRQRLAALDEAFANIDQPTADQRADHWQARARLAQQLSDAVAHEQGLA